MKTRLGLFLGVLGTALLAASGASANAVLSGSTTTDNGFFAYVSSNDSTLGTLIGSGNNWQQAFSVSSLSLSPGTYYLQIESINYGGPGGMSGIFTLTGGGDFLNGTQTLTTDPSNLGYWLGSYNDSTGTNPPVAAPWVTPTGAVLDETSNAWGNIVGTSNWIWPSDTSSSPSGATGPCAVCTVDFAAQFTVTGSTTGVPEPLTISLFGAGLAGAIAMRRRKAKA